MARESAVRRLRGARLQPCDRHKTSDLRQQSFLCGAAVRQAGRGVLRLGLPAKLDKEISG